MEMIFSIKRASIIGSLRYATDCTRPDIAYVVGVLARFTSKSNLDRRAHV